MNSISAEYSKKRKGYAPLLITPQLILNKSMDYKMIHGNQGFLPIKLNYKCTRGLVEKILGHEACLRAKAKSRIAFWEAEGMKSSKAGKGINKNDIKRKSSKNNKSPGSGQGTCRRVGDRP
jgi:hypothetical protein